MPDPLRLLVSFTALLVLIYPVQRLLLQPLAQVLEQRAQRTAGALETAERENAHARELQAALQARLVAARQQAQTERASLLAEAESAERSALARAREEASQLIDGIRTRVREESSRARTELPAMAGELAREAASVLLGRPL
jgi:F-type H+-transporting ATPase subunit b